MNVRPDLFTALCSKAALRPDLAASLQSARCRNRVRSETFDAVGIHRHDYPHSSESKGSSHNRET